MKEITIKKVSTTDQLFSKRTIKYDVYEDGEYTNTYTDINDVLDYQKQRMSDTTEQTIENALWEMYEGEGPDELFELVRDMRTFEDAGIPGTDRGLEITTVDGSKFQLTIRQSRVGW